MKSFTLVLLFVTVISFGAALDSWGLEQESCSEAILDTDEQQYCSKNTRADVPILDKHKIGARFYVNLKDMDKFTVRQTEYMNFRGMRFKVLFYNSTENNDQYLRVGGNIPSEDFANVEVGWITKMNVTIFSPKKSLPPFSKIIEIERSAFRAHYLQGSDNGNVMTWKKLEEYIDGNQLFIEIDVRVGGPIIIPDMFVTQPSLARLVSTIDDTE